MNALLAGIDLGGTKTEILVMRCDGTEIFRLRRPTPRGDYRGTLALIADLVAEAEHQCRTALKRIGIGIPGSPSPTTGLVRNANSTWLNGRPFGADLEDALDRPVRLSNDANCLALSEARDGAAAGADPVFAVILGTGVGGGLVVGGKLVGGAHGIGGEWGHMPLPGEWRTGPQCWCGRSGCVETYLSGPGIVADHRGAGGTAESVEAIQVAAEAGDATARATLARHADRLARGLGAVVNIVDPEVIVLGGGISRLPALADRLTQRLAAHVFLPGRDMETPRMVLAAFGDSSGVRGAARLWEDCE